MPSCTAAAQRGVASTRRSQRVGQSSPPHIRRRHPYCSPRNVCIKTACNHLLNERTRSNQSTVLSLKANLISLSSDAQWKWGGKQFSSAGSFDRKKEAEQDAARVAYEILATVGEDDIKEAVGLIDQDAVFCKSILYEFAVKTKTTWPSYCVVCLIKPLTLFAATVVFDGNSYTGESAPNKKDAEQSAARAVIKSILAKHNTCMVGIVRSKKQLITAVRSSGSTPATFICPVSYAAYGGPDHVAPMLQNASSSLAVQGGIRAVPAAGTSAN